MDNFLARFIGQIEPLPLDETQPALLAVSGGVDSMLLMHCWRRAQRPAIVAHCNFGLRGAESDADEALVAHTATTLGFPFYSIRFDTAAVAVERGVSIQMAARDLRYDWFAELCRTLEVAYLITAHHLQDALETVLINFVRGTGLKGMTGIAPSQYLAQYRLQVFRPMLIFTRDELLDCAREWGISWREDASNAKTDYLRNYLRHQVTPALEQAKPPFWPVVAQNLAHFRALEANYQYLLEQVAHRSVQSDGTVSLSLAPFLKMPFPESALWEILHPMGFTAEQVRQIVQLADQTGTDFFSKNNTRLLIDRGRLLIQEPMALREAAAPIRIEADDLMVRIPDEGRLFFTQAEASAPWPDGKEAVVVDAEALQYPLYLRQWRQGDAFQPFGMEGRRKKLQDFLTDARLSLYEKERVKVLVNADQEIIWVLGHRLDHRFRVKVTTKERRKISWLK